MASVIHTPWHSKGYVIILIILFILSLLTILSSFWKAPLEGRVVSSIVQTQDAVWIGTDSGAFRVVQNQSRLVFKESAVNTIAEVKGEIWLGTDIGAFWLDKDQYRPVFKASAVNSIAEVQDEIWLGTDTGAFRVVQDQPRPVFEGSPVNAITEAQGDVWLATDSGAYRVDRVDPVQLSRMFEGLPAYAITEAQGYVWIATYMGAFLVDTKELLPVLKGPPVNAITEAQKRVWLATHIGAYQADLAPQKRQAKILPKLKKHKVYAIEEAKEAVWLATDMGAYKVDQNQLLPRVLEGQNINAITEVQDTIWLATHIGAYWLKGNQVRAALDKPVVKWIGKRWYIALSCLALFGIFQYIRSGLAWFTQQREQQRRLENRQQRLSFEFDEAAKQARILFPPPEPVKLPGLHIEHRRRESLLFSGDFYNFIYATDRNIRIYFVDVEGHGVSAVNQARSLYQALSNSTWGYGDVRAELEHADHLVSDVSDNTPFKEEKSAFCMNFIEIDLDNMEVRHANAGMPFPLLFRAGESYPQPLQAVGIYVGAGYSQYPVQPDKVQVTVKHGDLLVIFSDGIIEAKDNHKRLFGQQGVISAVSRMRQESPEAIADEIMRAAAQHTGSDRPNDDQTLAVILIKRENNST